MKILAWDHLYVNNMRAKFQGDKIHLQKDIQILPTCVFGRMIFLNFTHKWWHYPKGWKNLSSNNICW